MQKLSLNDAWNETVSFVGREGRLLFPLAFMLIALPSGIVTAMMPEVAPGTLPPAGAWMIVLLVSIILGMGGQIALSFLALHANRSVGEAIGRGLRRLPALIGAVLLVALAGAVVMLVAAALLVLLSPNLDAAAPDAEAVSGAVAILSLILIAAGLYFGARLLMMTPLAAAEDLGSVQLIRRSWALTAGHVFRLLGFMLMVIALAIVINGAFAWVSGSAIILVAGPPRSGSLSSFLILLVGAAVQTVLTVFMSVIVARVYAQLTGGVSLTKGI
jgi:hypothetical protein